VRKRKGVLFSASRCTSKNRVGLLRILGYFVSDIMLESSTPYR